MAERKQPTLQEMRRRSRDTRIEALTAMGVTGAAEAVTFAATKNPNIIAPRDIFIYAAAVAALATFFTLRHTFHELRMLKRFERRKNPLRPKRHY
jgi:hypothetical protein